MKSPPWKCRTCREMAACPATIDYQTEIEHDGRAYRVEVPGLAVVKCQRCGAIVLDDVANQRVSEALRAVVGLLQPAEIRGARESLGLTQKQLAACLDVSEFTVSRWETGGQIQQKAMNRMLKTFFNCPEARAHLAHEAGFASDGAHHEVEPRGGAVEAGGTTAGQPFQGELPGQRKHSSSVLWKHEKEEGMARKSSPGVRTVTQNHLGEGLARVVGHLNRRGGPGSAQWKHHDEVYRDLERLRQHGLTVEFWGYLVDELAKWGVIRGKAGFDAGMLHARSDRWISLLVEHYNALVPEASKALPIIEDLQWKDVKPLFEAAYAIKGVIPSAFASKLCHFLVPSAYFMCDNDALVKRGSMAYCRYWVQCRAEWVKLSPSEKDARIQQLRDHLPPNYEPCLTYPWATKITEICQFQG